MKPCRFEGEVQNVEVHGSIPPEINGTFYRVMPDPQFPPFIENDVWFNGDGCVSAFRIHDGQVDFKQRFVRTEKFEREREANRALVGKYRNKYTDIADLKTRTTANTNILHFNGKLLACKEDGLPYAMDPDTLETLGLWDFEGQLESATFTAHPKFDPETGEMVCFGYEAKGDGTPDVNYYTFGRNGKIRENVWLVAPVVAMIHDFAVTKNYVIFPLIPQTCSLERMKAGGEHWQWDPTIPCYFGVLPRHGPKSGDVKWFRSRNAFPGHTANAYENEDGQITMDLPMSEKNVFFWWPDKNGNAPAPTDLCSQLSRVVFDPRSDNMDLPEPLIIAKEDVEFPRIDDRFAMMRHKYCFMNVMDHSLETNFAAIGAVMGGGYPLFNALGQLDLGTGEMKKYFVGAQSMVQEPVFIPRSKAADEGDGYVMALVNRYETMSSDLVILDARAWELVAEVKLPLRLRAGLHGNWVDASDLAR
ncbi:unnamed protein product [Penicillium manginii]